MDAFGQSGGAFPSDALSGECSPAGDAKKRTEFRVLYAARRAFMESNAAVKIQKMARGSLARAKLKRLSRSKEAENEVEVESDAVDSCSVDSKRSEEEPVPPISRWRVGEQVDRLVDEFVNMWIGAIIQAVHPGDLYDIVYVDTGVLEMNVEADKLRGRCVPCPLGMELWRVLCSFASDGTELCALSRVGRAARAAAERDAQVLWSILYHSNFGRCGSRCGLERAGQADLMLARRTAEKYAERFADLRREHLQLDEEEAGEVALFSRTPSPRSGDGRWAWAEEEQTENTGPGFGGGGPYQPFPSLPVQGGPLPYQHLSPWPSTPCASMPPASYSLGPCGPDPGHMQGGPPFMPTPQVPQGGGHMPPYNLAAASNGCFGGPTFMHGNQVNTATFSSGNQEFPGQKPPLSPMPAANAYPATAAASSSRGVRYDALVGLSNEDFLATLEVGLANMEAALTGTAAAPSERA